MRAIRRLAAFVALLAALAGQADAATLVAWWRLDETTGTTLKDSTGNGHDATLSGSYTLGAAPAPGIRFPNPGAVAFTNGTGTGAGAGLPAVDAPLSISLWVFLSPSNSVGEAATIVTAAGKVYRVQIQGSTKIFVDSSSAILVQRTLATFASMWSHICVTYDGAVDTIYYNGVSVATASVAHETGAASSVLIGKYSTEPVVGTLDDIRIYSGALTADQVRDLASGGPTEDSGFFGGGAWWAPTPRQWVPWAISDTMDLGPWDAGGGWLNRVAAPVVALARELN